MQPDLEAAAEDFPDDLRLASAQEAVVDEDARKLVADGLVDERGGHARVHPAAQAENDPFAAYLRADFRHGLVHVVAHRPLTAAAADVVNEVADDLRAAWGVRHFVMELEAEKFLHAVFDCGVVRVFRGGYGFEAGGKTSELVAVGIPNLHLCRRGK